MFKKILVSSMLLTGVLGASTALAHTDSVNKVSSSESQSSIASSFSAGPIDFNFSTSYTVGEFIHVGANESGATIAIQNDKPFNYNIVLRNTETNEVRSASTTGGLIGSHYQDTTDFGSLAAGTYEVVLENTDGTVQQGQLWMWAY